MNNLTGWSKSSLAILTVSMLPFTAACGSGEQEPSAAVRPSPASTANEESEVVFDTIVSRQPDGSYTVRTVPITLAERHRQELERETRGQTNALESGTGSVSEAVVQLDSSCTGTSWWGYDGANQTGNRLCLDQPDQATASKSLSTWCHNYTCGTFCFCAATWSAHVASYWSGAKQGTIYTTGIGQNFGTYEKGNTATTSYTDITLTCPNPNDTTCPG